MYKNGYANFTKATFLFQFLQNNQINKFLRIFFETVFFGNKFLSCTCCYGCSILAVGVHVCSLEIKYVQRIKMRSTPTIRILPTLTISIQNYLYRKEKLPVRRNVNSRKLTPVRIQHLHKIHNTRKYTSNIRREFIQSKCFHTN